MGILKSLYSAEHLVLIQEPVVSKPVLEQEGNID